MGILTDHTVAGGDVNLRAEYVTRPGRQRYESPGWLSGEELWVVVPHGVGVHEIAFRESGYDTEPSGVFSCDDPFVMRFWQKALRTLYVNMRDTFFDCPDRERAQWWGDVVVMMGELFYTYSPSAHALMRKAMLELAAWQKPDGALFSPIPAGNYDSELPGQMLAAVGRYGFWNYYMHTGDRSTIERVYPAVKRYLALWKTDPTGLTGMRRGGWNWGDWGDERDMRLIYAGWHALALEGAANMAGVLGLDDDAAGYRAERERVAAGYERCWNGTAYRHPDYTGSTDDGCRHWPWWRALPVRRSTTRSSPPCGRRSMPAPIWRNTCWRRCSAWGTAITLWSVSGDALRRWWTIPVVRRFSRGGISAMRNTAAERRTTHGAAAADGDRRAGLRHPAFGSRLQAVRRGSGLQPDAAGLDFGADGRGRHPRVVASREEGLELRLTVPEGTTACVSVPGRDAVDYQPGKHTIRIN